MERVVVGKWAKQAEVAARTIRTNEILHATDVDTQRRQNACLGTAVNLEMDAVRLVLTGDYDVARDYFSAIRELTLSAIEAGETWVFTDVFFARCEALRLRANAGWAIEAADWRADIAAAVDSWSKLAEAETSIDPAKRNAHVILSLLAAHHGDFARASAVVASVDECDRAKPWCDLLWLMKGLKKLEIEQRNQWSRFFSSSVISPVVDELVGGEFNAGEACMIANVRARVNNLSLQPFEIIRTLRH